MPLDAAAAATIARSFVDARLSGRALPAYPGPLPASLEAAYAIQDAAIGLWPDELVGWKIGLTPSDLRASLGADRIAGPIFSRQTYVASGADALELPVIVDGFAAVEAEFVLRIGADQDPAKRDWRAQDAMDMIDAVHIGIELAGSPFAGINDNGPAVTISDFGNNAGLVVGPAVANWRDSGWASMRVTAKVTGADVGEGEAALLPGGPNAAIAFILNHCASRGRPLRKGAWISSGAVTGVHRIEAGQSAEFSFGSLGALRCHATPARGLTHAAVGAN